MTTPTPRGPSTATVVGIVVVFCFTVAGVVGLTVTVPNRAQTLITVLLASVAPTVAALAGLAKLGTVDKRTEDLTNGLMDSKVRAAVADVIRNQMIDPAAKQQLDADRLKRDPHTRGDT